MFNWIKKLIFKNRLTYSMALIFIWPISLAILLLDTVSQSVIESIYIFKHVCSDFFWPIFSRQFFEEKQAEIYKEKQLRGVMKDRELLELAAKAAEKAHGITDEPQEPIS